MANQTRSPPSLFLLALVEVFDENLYSAERMTPVIKGAISDLQRVVNIQLYLIDHRRTMLWSELRYVRHSVSMCMKTLWNRVDWRVMLLTNLPSFLPLDDEDKVVIRESRELFAPYLINIINDDSPEYANEVLMGCAPAFIY
jgi:hypothetical protein